MKIGDDMEKEVLRKLEEIAVRQDLMFSVISNDYLAQQAMQIYSSIMKGVEAEPDNKELKEVAEKSLESFKFHGENVNDAVTYYYDIFGEEANLGVDALMKARGIEREPATSPVADVKSSSSHTSEKA